jgi:hypothetical protein
MNLLYTNFKWNPSRIATFAELILGVVKTRTVKIKELALNINSKGKTKAIGMCIGFMNYNLLDICFDKDDKIIDILVR